MRNRKFIYAVLALMTLGFAGCQQEDDFTPQGGEKELRIATRSTAPEGTAEAFTRVYIASVVNATRISCSCGAKSSSC